VETVTDHLAGFLGVGVDENDEVVINHPDLKPDENGVGHIVFSVSQARNLARILEQKAREAEASQRAKTAAARIAALPPVDRSARVLASGDGPVPEDQRHTELKPNGQQRDYVVLSAEERAKGFVRPVRRSYRHEKCGGVTSMSQAIAETYARDPGFYSGTFCTSCGAHFPIATFGQLGEFVWIDDGSKVGS
jgi:hypothetical protein